MENEEIKEETVNTESPKKEKESSFLGAFKALMKFKAGKALVLIVVALIAAVVIYFSFGSTITHDTKATKLRFENVGELVTQSAYCTEVNVTDDSRNAFGITIPFTESKVIYSYDAIIKAGVDFAEIDYKVNESTKTINVVVPDAKIISAELDLDSFKVYHEQESIFNNITLEDNNEAQKQMKENAVQGAIENGLLENAKENAKALIRNFFANDYDLTVYEVVFEEGE